MSSEVETIAKMVTGAALIRSLLEDKWGRQHAFLPKAVPAANGVSYERQDITPKDAIKIDPAFIDQLVNIDQAASLVDYVNRFKTADTVIFADGDEIVAVIEYHKGQSAAPGLVEHLAILSLTPSAEWDTWAAISGRMYDQKSFARMLDINSDDIAQPEAATL